MTEKLTDTVWAFIDRASDLYGRTQAENFGQDAQANCLELGLQSPIEQLFWVAADAICGARRQAINPPRLADGTLADGIYINPQMQVGRYRVDFSIVSVGYGPREHLPPVVVELDGHDFHDKDKRQRSYEKKRDRDLQREGFKVLHFTGSDVVKDPFACAWEALDAVGLFVGTGIAGYSPTDPFGSGE
jgi:very-short-patch-repair endonuclease